MNFIKENKLLLTKYLFILISNILMVIICNFYFKDSLYKDIILLFIIIILNMLIYYYKEKIKFRMHLDFITNIIIGILLMAIFKDPILYGSTLFSLVFSNNIIFNRSRLKESFFKKTLQYIIMIVLTLCSLFINLLIFNLIN